MSETRTITATRKIWFTGGNFVITIPRELVTKEGWMLGDYLEVEMKRKIRKRGR